MTGRAFPWNDSEAAIKRAGTHTASAWEPWTSDFTPAIAAHGSRWHVQAIITYSHCVGQPPGAFPTSDADLQSEELHRAESRGWESAVDACRIGTDTVATCRGRQSRLYGGRKLVCALTTSLGCGSLGRGMKHKGDWAAAGEFLRATVGQSHCNLAY